MPFKRKKKVWAITRKLFRWAWKSGLQAYVQQEIEYELEKRQH